MNENDLAYFKNIILEKRRDVLHSISTTEMINLEKRTHPNGGEISQYSTHMADQGSDAIPIHNIAHNVRINLDLKIPQVVHVIVTEQ